MTDLIKRLEALEAGGGSKELDVQIEVALSSGLARANTAGTKVIYNYKGRDETYCLFVQARDWSADANRAKTIASLSARKDG
jgi:hypothetical protein